MVKLECAKCRYYGPLTSDADGEKCCNYSWITGHCRTTLPPREDGLCPGYEAGPRAKANPKRHENPIRKQPPGGRPMKYDGKQMLALYREGLSDPEIGDQVGAPARSVCAWRQRHGLPANVTQGGKKVKGNG